MKMTLEETLIDEELGNVDLSQITALQHKRTIAFVNHFVLTNVQFFNNFMKKCEHSLMKFERKLEKINAAMVLLETRLSSIPEINTPTSVPDVVDSKPLEEPQETPTEEPQANPPAAVTETVVESKPLRPEYDRFVKMIHVGVPLPAVKLKISMEGLDPNVLDELLAK